MNGKRRVGLLIASLLCITGLFVASASASSALADTTNPDGSHTATSTFPSFPCPTTFNGTTSSFMSVFIPFGATNVTHLLTLACPGSTTTDSFNPNASDPPPSAGDQTARDDFTITCNQGGGCAGGFQPGRLDVTYFLPGGPNGQLLSPDLQRVTVDKNGKAVVEFTQPGEVGHEMDFVELFWTTAFFVHPRSANRSLQARDAKAKTIRIGTLPDTHISASEKTIKIPFRLNARGRELLRASGKVKATLHGTLRNSAGSAAVTYKFKLVSKK